MLGHDDFYAHFGRALHDRIKVVDLEPPSQRFST
jgi:hypothetical protein